MQYVKLGQTGVKVSPLCLGTMNFGWKTSETDAHAIMDRALELGINFFDTADVYGWDVHQGYTEEIIGRWLKARGPKARDRVVLATKVYNPVRREGEPEPNRDTRCLSALKIIRHCEDSLRRLQTDVIDLYQMHHVDRECRWQEIWQAMETLVRQGKIIYVGSSNFAGWDIATACQEATQRGLMALASEQSIYHLDNRQVELEVIPACRHYGLGLIPWSPLGGGLLGGVLKQQSEGRRGDEDFQKKVASKRRQLEAYEGLCEELGEAPANVALSWLLQNPVVTAPIVGPRTSAQLEQSVHATELQLDAATLERLDEIFPGPGEAPAAYAW
jgi:aryl-alcohol dehydrogenase-like predicted oxidoreductase